MTQLTVGNIQYYIVPVIQQQFKSKLKLVSAMKNLKNPKSLGAAVAAVKTVAAAAKSAGNSNTAPDVSSAKMYCRSFRLTHQIHPSIKVTYHSI